MDWRGHVFATYESKCLLLDPAAAHTIRKETEYERTQRPRAEIDAGDLQIQSRYLIRVHLN